jgi:hypothetical protein
LFPSLFCFSSPWTQNFIILLFIRNQIFCWVALFTFLLSLQCVLFYTKKSYLRACPWNKYAGFSGQGCSAPRLSVGSSRANCTHLEYRDRDAAILIEVGLHFC